MNINNWKSGMMRILSKKGKIKGISNELNIPEIKYYCYLGVKLNQTLKRKEHIKDMRIKKYMRRRIGMLKTSIINTKCRMIIFKTILRTKFIYAAAILWYFNPEYIKTWNSILYRVLKLIFHIKINLCKDLLFKILEIEDTNEMMTKVINKLNWKIEVNQTETYKTLIDQSNKIKTKLLI